MAELKCHLCPECNGYGCPGMIPGLGGVFEGKNFQLNFEAWKDLYRKASAHNSVVERKTPKIDEIEINPQMFRCGPVTGAVENIGYDNEKEFYLPYLKNAYFAGLGLCVGDGCPDEKLQFGVEAVQTLRKIHNSEISAAFFLKPYPQEKLFERIDLIKPCAEYIGVDIDSFNILTMRNLVNLEKKTAEQLDELRKYSGLPFVVKGVFTDSDIEMVKNLRPDVVYISNHGGRVETRIGSTGEFLAEHAVELKKYCDQIWVDGGIRCKQDAQTAVYYGADKVIAARPLIRGTFDGNYEQVVKELLG